MMVKLMLSYYETSNSYSLIKNLLLNMMVILVNHFSVIFGYFKENSYLVSGYVDLLLRVGYARRKELVI